MRVARMRFVVGIFSYSLLLGCCLCIAWPASPASAEDLYSPPWRGGEGTTLTSWEYDSNSLHPVPDEELNPFGTSWTDIYPEQGEEWQPLWGGRAGVWPLSGAIEVQIDNRWPSPADYYKDIWVQLSWAPQTAGATPSVLETLFVAPGSIINDVVQEPTNAPPPADGNWRHTTFLIHLEPNPAWEIIRIEGDIMVDELVIDTICIPEPMAMALLAVGGLALLRRPLRR